MTHPLIGIWNGCSNPMQETNVIFFSDGHGLLFFFWGSQGPANLSEFTWQPVTEASIKVEWIVRHRYDYELLDDNDPEEDAESNDDSIIDFTITDEGLMINIGMHDMPNSLNRVAAPGNFSEEKIKWTEYTKEFSPFMKGRQVWITDGKKWQKTPFSTPQPSAKLWWKFWE